MPEPAGTRMTAMRSAGTESTVVAPAPARMSARSAAFVPGAKVTT